MQPSKSQAIQASDEDGIRVALYKTLDGTLDPDEARKDEARKYACLRLLRAIWNARESSGERSSFLAF
ncbi:MAG: hypothetical protein ACRCSF_01790 [Mycobacteriaceae bacterium]